MKKLIFVIFACLVIAVIWIENPLKFKEIIFEKKLEPLHSKFATEAQVEPKKTPCEQEIDLLTSRVAIDSNTNQYTDCEMFLPFGYPKVKGEDNPIMSCHKGYVIQYNKDKKAPYWSAEKLDKCMVNALQGDRPKENFAPDSLVVAKQLPYVKSDDYNINDAKTGGSSCYERGHMTPDSDLRWDSVPVESTTNASVETFNYANTIPQYPVNNEQIWMRLENNVKNWAKNGKNLYIITGPIFSPQASIVFNDSIPVPDKLYKIIIDKDNKEYAAFVIPNQDVKYCMLEKFYTSIEDIEKQTNIDFLQDNNIKRNDQSFPLTITPQIYCDNVDRFKALLPLCQDQYYHAPLPEDSCSIKTCTENSDKRIDTSNNASNTESVTVEQPKAN